MVETEDTEAALFPERAGDILRAARLKAGLDPTDIATKTRVPLRHLEGIEAGDYSSLPSSTYCVGFVKAYARAVGADENALGNAVRVEIDAAAPQKQTFVATEISDQKRIPTALLAWTAAGIGLFILAAYALSLGLSNADPRDTPPIVAEAAETSVPKQATPAATPVAPTGAVTLTAVKEVWLKIYEADGKRLFEKEMAAGETFTVPEDAVRPQILTGRPDALQVSIGGRVLAPLGPPERTVKDLDISAAALIARAPIAPAAASQP